MHVAYNNELPVECLMESIAIKTSGQYEARKAEFGLHLYGIATYGASQAMQAQFGRPSSPLLSAANPPLSEVCPTEAELAAGRELVSFLEDLPECENQVFAAGAMEAGFEMNPALVAMLIELAKTAIQAWLKKWQDRRD